MKRAWIVIPIILVIVIAGYFYQWQQQSKRFHAMAVSAIERLNAGEEAAGVDFRLEYDALEVTGFPLKHELVITHPVLHEHYSTTALGDWIASHWGQSPSDHGRNAPTTPIDGRLELDGALRLGLHYFSSRADIALDGKLSGEDNIHQETLHWTSDHPALNQCSAHLRPSATLGLLQTFLLQKPSDFRQWSKYLDRVRCELPPQRLLERETAQPLAASGPIAVEIGSLLLEESKTEGHLVLHMDDVEMHDRMRQFYASFSSDLPPSRNVILPLQRHDLVGKSDTEMDINFKLHVKPDTDGAKETKLHEAQYLLVDAKNLSFSNDFGTVSLPFLLETRDQDGTIGFKLRHQGQTRLQPSFDQALEESLQQLAEQPQTAAELETQFDNPDAAALVKDYVSDIVPKFSGFGTIRTAIDLDASTQAGVPSLALPSGITLKTLEFVSDVYTLKLSGSFASASKEGLLNLECLHCDRLIADATEYHNRVQKFSSQLHQQARPQLVTPELYDAMIGFLATIDTDEREEVLGISVVSNGQGGITISGKTLLQVLPEALSRFQPFLSDSPLLP